MQATLNDLETCRELGRRAQKSTPAYQRMRERARQFVNARPEEQHAELRAAFNEGYNAEYGASACKGIGLGRIVK